MLTGQSESLKEWMCKNAQVTLLIIYTLIANFSNWKILSLGKARCSAPESHVRMTHTTPHENEEHYPEITFKHAMVMSTC